VTTLIQPSTSSRIPPARRRPAAHRFAVLAWIATAISVVITVYLTVVWPIISRWGATETEAERELPGDDLIVNPLLVTTKAVTIQASPEEIWPWLAQLGVDRGGMYSYLWVENGLLHLNVKNTDEIRPEWQNIQVGDFLRFTPKDFPLNPGPGLYVLAVEPNRFLVGCFGLENAAANCNAAATWQFVLEPQPDNTTRFILRGRTAGEPTGPARFGAKLGYVFQFYMERKMLLTLKEHAEAHAGQQQ